MSVLRSGCLCCSVRTCVLIQGWTYTAISTLFVIFILVMFRNLDTLYYGGPPSQERRDVWSFGTYVLILGFLCGLLTMGVQCTMLVGIYKRRSWMLVPHLVLTAVLTLGITVAVLVNQQTGIITVVVVAFFVCIQTYFWFHVLSHYIDLRHVENAVYPTRSSIIGYSVTELEE